jgi:hypothetical protein
LIGNQTKGRGFRGCLNYLLNKEKAELIGGNMIGVTPRELATEFSLAYELNDKVSRPVYHASLSLPPGQRLSDEQWNDLAASYLERMGFTDNQYIVVRHSDRDHDHIHIVASRVRLDGTCVHDSWDYRRSEAILRSLEQQYNLEPVQPSWEVEKRGLTKGQQLQHRRELQQELEPTPSVREQIQLAVDSAIADSTTTEQFLKRLGDFGVEARLRTKRDGTINGISYQYLKAGVTEVATPGNKLGIDYSWKGIQRRLELQQQRQQELERIHEPNKQWRSPLERCTDLELLQLAIATQDYFDKKPPQPTLEEKRALEQQAEWFQKEIARLTDIYSEKIEKLEKVPAIKRLIPSIGKQWEQDLSECNTLLAKTQKTCQALEQTQEKLSQWQQLTQLHQQWENSPTTQKMLQLIEELNQPQVQSRLEALKQEQQRQLAQKQIQREGSETALAVQNMFRLTGTKKQPDGSLILDATSWRFEQRGNTVSVTVKADRREILRVEGDKTVVFNPTPNEREKMQSFREQVQSAWQKEQQRQQEALRKQSRGFSL